MSKKLYFNAADIEYEGLCCFPLEHHQCEMEMEGEASRTLHRARPEKGTGVFYCREFDFVGEKGEHCGRQCDSYEPRSGKNGICRHSTRCYEPDGTEVVVLKNAMLHTEHEPG